MEETKEEATPPKSAAVLRAEKRRLKILSNEKNRMSVAMGEADAKDVLKTPQSEDSVNRAAAAVSSLSIDESAQTQTSLKSDLDLETSSPLTSPAPSPTPAAPKPGPAPAPVSSASSASSASASSPSSSSSSSSSLSSSSATATPTKSVAVLRAEKRRNKILSDEKSRMSVAMGEADAKDVLTSTTPTSTTPKSRVVPDASAGAGAKDKATSDFIRQIEEEVKANTQKNDDEVLSGPGPRGKLRQASSSSSSSSSSTTVATKEMEEQQEQIRIEQVLSVKYAPTRSWIPLLRAFAIVVIGYWSPYSSVAISLFFVKFIFAFLSNIAKISPSSTESKQGGWMATAFSYVTFFLSTGIWKLIFDYALAETSEVCLYIFARSIRQFISNDSMTISDFISSSTLGEAGEGGVKGGAFSGTIGSEEDAIFAASTTEGDFFFEENEEEDFFVSGEEL